VPYRVTNFLYITSPDIRYIIVDDDIGSYSLADELNRTLPPDYIEKRGKKRLFMNKELVDNTNDLGDKNNYKVKFIFFDNPSGGLSTGKDVSAINIKSDSSCSGSSEEILDCFW